MAPVRGMREMLANLAPRLLPDSYVFCTTEDESLGAEAARLARATFCEAEGLSLVLTEADARRLGFDVALPMRCITLKVHSALDGVGLTAAVARALAQAGIACNVIAAYHHDHAFIPAERAEEALERLQALARCTDIEAANG